jgi:integrase/recombinase XerC
LTEDEVIEIIKNISGGHFYRLRNAAGILILATLGLRINQLLDIKLKDVKTVEHGYDITFKELKKKYSQNNRTLPIVNELYIGGFSVTRILTDYLKERNSIEVKSPYLFVNKFGKKLSDGLFRIMLNDVSNEALGYSITPHYLRHYVVSNCAKNHGITSAALLAGHSNVTTTQKYVSEKNFDFKEIIGINHG